MGLLSRAADRSSAEPPETNTLEESIARYYEDNGNFHCLVFEYPASAGGDEKAGLINKVSEMINKAGLVVPLSLSRPLILLPLSIDRELIAHRISKSLKTMPLLSFEANNPENALSKLKSLL